MLLHFSAWYLTEFFWWRDEVLLYPRNTLYICTEAFPVFWKLYNEGIISQELDSFNKPLGLFICFNMFRLQDDSTFKTVTVLC